MTSAEAVSAEGLPSDSAAAGPAAPLIPRYGECSLADLATSVLAAFGVPGEANPLGLPPTSRVCLLVVDGLGWNLLREYPAAAPFLSELARSGRPLTAGFPATTVTSLSSLGTGLPPGQHGMLGYQVAVPQTGRLLNALRWDKRVDPLAWQPSSTIFERAAAAGIAAYRIAQGSYRDSGLSTAVMRGAIYRSADTLGALVGQTAAVLAAEPRALAMVYEAGLDATGHVFGCGSDAWRFQLGHVDRLAEQLAAALPQDTALYITADHGMVDVGPADRIDADSQPGLRDGVAILGGEPRARHVYAQPGAAADVLAAWRDLLAGSAWVASREQAIADGWFGSVSPALTDRIGDVVAACAGARAVVATRAEPRETALLGMHGSLAASDQLIPLLAQGPG
ncbi:MAG TPA: nucleotide pyrophosphatase/phosphodiesterase family protein [Streptosporangiaceae bacterium]|nr:nucleotide pyrophosphatase/phosphodiesterase family protein [Streptosporangiaceae bacterium]